MKTSFTSRTFQTWEFRVSHGQLLIRSPKTSVVNHHREVPFHFYPDFVCKLKNGKNLVVEYKAEHYGDKDDTDEKERVGQLWAARSNGHSLFLKIRGQNQLGKIQETVEKSLATRLT